jgi:hypothetical protein
MGRRSGSTPAWPEIGSIHPPWVCDDGPLDVRPVRSIAAKAKGFQSFPSPPDSYPVTMAEQHPCRRCHLTGADGGSRVSSRRRRACGGCRRRAGTATTRS